MHFDLKIFQDLTNSELYQILQLRAEVFVVEQNCPYQDLDGKDLQAHHLLLWNRGRLIGYTRILNKGISYPDHISIGRVVTSPSVRGKGFGKDLMKKSIQVCYEIYGDVPIKISAQYHLQKFYEEFGFNSIGDQYLEDDIPHIAMVKCNYK